MYPHLIEVHSHGNLLSVNIDHIAMIGEKVIHLDCPIDDTAHWTFYETDESYHELKALIRDAGCQITKADPRLDMTTPLTMDVINVG